MAAPAKRRCATTAVLDVDLGAALPIKDVDWLVVEEASAGHGDVAQSDDHTRAHDKDSGRLDSSRQDRAVPCEGGRGDLKSS